MTRSKRVEYIVVDDMSPQLKVSAERLEEVYRSLQKALNKSIKDLPKYRNNRKGRALRNIRNRNNMRKQLLAMSKNDKFFVRLYWDSRKKCFIIDRSVMSRSYEAPVNLGVFEQEEGCEVGNHDWIPRMGFGNEVLGDVCRQCGVILS